MNEIQICNSALRQVGGNPIASFQDNIEEAELCAEFYPQLRDFMLSDYIWTFARKRVSLAKLADPPEVNYDYLCRFQLPADCLSIFETVPHRLDYTIEGCELLCNEASVFIRYIFRLEDPSKYSPHFIHAFIMGMISKLRNPITKQIRQTDNDENKFLAALEYAKSQDAQQERGQVHIHDVYTSVRF